MSKLCEFLIISADTAYYVIYYIRSESCDTHLSNESYIIIICSVFNEIWVYQVDIKNHLDSFLRHCTCNSKILIKLLMKWRDCLSYIKSMNFAPEVAIMDTDLMKCQALVKVFPNITLLIY